MYSRPDSSRRLALTRIKPWVYQCCGLFRYFGRWAVLDQISAVHHGDGFAQVPYDAEVMADYDHSQSTLHLYSRQHVQDQSLTNGVQVGRRFVGDQEPWFDTTSAIAIIDPLPHAAGQFVWIGPQPLLRDRQFVEQFVGTYRGLARDIFLSCTRSVSTS